SDNTACDEALPAFVLAREHENRFAFSNVLAAIHGLLRGESERRRTRIAHLGFDRERHDPPSRRKHQYHPGRPLTLAHWSGLAHGRGTAPSRSGCQTHVLPCCRHHRPIAHLCQARAIEAIERSAHATTIRTELSDLDPVAFLGISREMKWSAHRIGAVA